MRLCRVRSWSPRPEIFHPRSRQPRRQRGQGCRLPPRLQIVGKSWHFFGGYARRQDPAVGGAAKVLQPQLVFGLVTAFDCLPTERWPPDAYLLAENHTLEGLLDAIRGG